MKENEIVTKVERAIYKIGLFAQMNRITIKTLRHYDEMGLLHPEHIDESSGYRYYTSEQLPTLHQILALRQMGFSLEEIKKAQEGMSVEDLLLNKKAELIKKIAEENMKLSQVEFYLIHKGADRNYNIILKELPEVIVASMRSVIPHYDALNSVMPLMGQEMERIGCERAIPDYCFNIYHDAEYREEQIDVEMCEAVIEKKEDSPLVTFKTLERVETAACTLHKGSYAEFPKAYRAVLAWMEENDFEMAGFPRESYIDGIWNKDSEEEWLTEIQFPVRKVKG